MIPPKTTWQSGDPFGETDYDRITANIREVWPQVLDTALPTFAAITDATLYYTSHRETIVNAANQLIYATTYGIQRIQPYGFQWFTPDELNRIELVCLLIGEGLDPVWRYGSGLVYGTGLVYTATEEEL